MSVLTMSKGYRAGLVLARMLTLGLVLKAPEAICIAWFFPLFSFDSLFYNYIQAEACFRRM